MVEVFKFNVPVFPPAFDSTVSLKYESIKKMKLKCYILIYSQAYNPYLTPISQVEYPFFQSFLVLKFEYCWWIKNLEVF